MTLENKLHSSNSTDSDLAVSVAKHTCLLPLYIAKGLYISSIYTVFFGVAVPLIIASDIAGSVISPPISGIMNLYNKYCSKFVNKCAKFSFYAGKKIGSRILLLSLCTSLYQHCNQKTPSTSPDYSDKVYQFNKNDISDLMNLRIDLDKMHENQPAPESTDKDKIR